jgi:hypothetical protein
MENIQNAPNAIGNWEWTEGKREGLIKTGRKKRENSNLLEE